MTRLSTLLLILLTSLHVVAQQRYADLKVNLLDPKQGDTIYIDDQFNISAKVINLGADTVHSSDTLGLGLIFDGNPIMFYLNGTPVQYLPMDGYEIAPGDSVTIGFSFTVSTGWQTGPTTFCAEVTPINATDSITDTALSNNQSCANLKILEHTTSVTTASKQNSIVVIYPNPVSDILNMAFELSVQKQVSLKITDMSGRVVISNEWGDMSKGMNKLSVNTGLLAPGMYLYELQLDKERVKGRFNKQ